MSSEDKLMVERLDVDIYATWSVRMRALLTIKGVWSAVTGTSTDPQEDAKALALIALHVKDHHLTTVGESTTARGAWETLKNIYESKTNARKLLLRKELTQLKKGPAEPITKYVARAKEIQSQLRAAGHTVADQDLAFSVLAGLPASYNTINTVLTSSDRELKIDEILPKLQQQEQMMQPESDAEAALFAKRRGSFGKKPTSGFGSYKPMERRKETRKCIYCKQVGHLIANCWQRKRDEAQSGSSTQPKKNGQLGAIALSAYGSMSSTAETSVLAATDSTYRWVLDSGASRHITAHQSILLNTRCITEPITITFGNGEASTATHVGDVMLHTPATAFLLKDVLHVPGASENLLSVHSATKKGVEFKFGPTKCDMVLNGELVAHAPCTDDIIYYLSGKCERSKTVAPALASAATQETPQLWHERFGHLSYENLARLRARNMVTGITTMADEFKTANKAEELCEPCTLGKHHRSPFPPSSSKTQRPLALLHTDVCGPLPVTSRGGNNYFVTILDDYSKLSLVLPIAHKSDTTPATKETITFLENQADCRVQRLRCDNGGEYINETLKSFCRNKGIKLETTVRYTPQQNGAAERLNRTLMDKVRPMLNGSGLPKIYWAEALATANYVRNRSPASGQDKTPWELFYGKKPNVSHLRVFGERVYAHVPKELRNKLADTSQPGKFIGYPPGTKGYKILLDTGQIIISRDVTVKGGTSDDDMAEIDDSPMEETPPEPMATEPGSSTAGQAAQEPAAASSQRPKRSAAQVPATIWQEEGYKITGKRHRASVAFSASIAEPTTMEEALASEQAEEWKHAMDEEMASLLANKTWELEHPPRGVTPIPVKWVYKIKRNSSGEIERYKARLVVKGYRQREGIDYEEVFAPVSKYSTVRAVLAMAATEDMEIHQLDIKTAFLNGDLEEEVWCEQPAGYEEGSGLACHLRKSLYGLKQAPRAWHLRLKAELERIGFQESAADPGLFIKTGDVRLYLLVYVDDLALVTPNTVELDKTKQQIMTAFEARDLGPSSFFLGMDIIRDRNARTITLAQHRLTKDLLTKYGMTEAKSLSTPLSLATKLTKTGEPLDTGSHPYSQLIGSLMYLSVCTRPDISQAVGALARYMANPTKEHWQAATNVLRYLAGTAEYGITFGAGSPGLEAYCDADYAGDIDTRRSTTGYVFLLNGGAISWSSRLQQTVAASTTEAEYMAAAAAIKEALWIRRLINELEMDTKTITIKADSQSAIKLLKNPLISMRSKHIDVIYHFARERVTRNDVAFEYIRTDEMVADALTKPLPAAKFQFCRAEMGING